MKKMNIIVMNIAGLLLLVAAVLKTQQLLIEPVVSEGFWESWKFFLIQIPLEMGLGIWLLSGLFRKAVHLLATIAFGGFILVVLGKALGGFESCGCFGTIKVNPWITVFAIDVPIFLLLLIFRPVGCKLLPPPWPKAAHFFAIAIPTFILLPTVMLTLIFNKPPDKSDTYEVVNTAEWMAVLPERPAVAKPAPATKLVVAEEDNEADMPGQQDLTVVPVPVDVNINRSSEATEPNAAAPHAAVELSVAVRAGTAVEPNAVIEGNAAVKPSAAAEPPKQLIRWPMLEHIDIAETLSSGIWVVLMYHKTCPACAEAIPIYEQYQRSLVGNDDAIRFAFIGMAPYAEPGQGPVASDSICTLGRLSDAKKWFVQTPVVVILLDGGVLGAWEGYAPNLDEIFDTAFSN